MRPPAPLVANDSSPCLTDAPYIICPYHPRFLRPETRAAVPDAVYVDVSRDDQAYWRLLRELWTQRATFILVEHDIAPNVDQITRMWTCPQQWCTHAYPMGDIEAPAFGLVKFGEDLISETANLIDGIIERHRIWTGLDSIVIAELHRRRYKEHVHQPSVRHLREYGPIPQPEPRRHILTKLHYVGDGTRYIHGFPAADFNTDDPTAVAICIESGLYVVAPPTIRKVRRPDILTKFIPFEPEVEIPVESTPETISVEKETS